MSIFASIIDTEGITLTSEHVLAALAGAASDALTERVRSVMVTAATTRLGDHPMGDDDRVLTLDCRYSFTRAELLHFLANGI